VIAVDTNILVYAHREELPLHARAHHRLAGLAEGDVPWALPVFCIGEFLRVVTHGRLFNPPTSIEQALEAIANLYASPTVTVLSPGADANCGRARESYIRCADRGALPRTWHRHDPY
jgi:predicted nucleic acid-binding protein